MIDDICGPSSRPNYIAQYRESCRRFAERLAEIGELAPHQRAKFVREFEEKQVLSMCDDLADEMKGRGKFK